MKCNNCGKELKKESRFCTACGIRVIEEKSSDTQTSNVQGANIKNIQTDAVQDPGTQNGSPQISNNQDIDVQIGTVQKQNMQGVNMQNGSVQMSNTQGMNMQNGSVQMPNIQLQNQNENKKKPKKTRNVMIAAAVVLVGIIASVGACVYYFSQNDKAEQAKVEDVSKEKYGGQKNDDNTLEETATPVPTETPTEEPTKEPVETPTEIPEEDYPFPHIEQVRATSTLKSNKDNDYVAENVCDGDEDTAWVEGKAGDGIGEYIKLKLEEETIVHGIKVSNGYYKNSDLYYRNNRVKKVKLTFSDGSSKTYKLDDNFLEVCDVEFDEPVLTSTIKVEILSVYKSESINGKKAYKDTCITELEVY